MKKFFSNVFTPIKAKVSHARNRAKLMMMGAAIAALTPIGASAQNLAGTGYDAGTSALGGRIRVGQVHSVCSQLVLCSCWYLCRCRCHLSVHRHECVRNGCMINSSLARG